MPGQRLGGRDVPGVIGMQVIVAVVGRLSLAYEESAKSSYSDAEGLDQSCSESPARCSKRSGVRPEVGTRLRLDFGNVVAGAK